MEYFGTSDLPALLADTGVPVSWGSVTGIGVVDQVDRELLQDQSIQFTGREVQVTLETTKFGAMKSGATLVVDSVNHFVIQTRRTGDGALTEALCVPS